MLVVLVLSFDGFMLIWKLKTILLRSSTTLFYCEVIIPPQSWITAEPAYSISSQERLTGLLPPCISSSTTVLSDNFGVQHCQQLVDIPISPKDCRLCVASFSSII